MDDAVTLSHRLVLPGDANHHGTLYAGALLRIALEAAYATAYRCVGADANLVLRRVLGVECYQPVPVGRVIEIRGAVVYASRAY
ncbi:MAG: acyl-CoA thioesterase, partial [Planctomycetia bacterium]